MVPRYGLFGPATMLWLMLALGGCGTDGALAPAGVSVPLPSAYIGDVVPPTLTGERFTVCKAGSGEGVFDIFEDESATPARSALIGNGKCVVVAGMGLPPYEHPEVRGHRVLVRERGSSWWRTSSVHLQVGHEAAYYPHTRTRHPAEVRLDRVYTAGIDTASGPISRGVPSPDDYVGALATFTSVPIPLGREACPASFWRQDRHRVEWIRHTPSTPFATAFGIDAFPGKTLLQVLKDEGAGLPGLGREAVAALLNGAGGQLDFEMTPAEVIAVFRAARADPSQVETSRRQLEARNQGFSCPL